MKFFDCPRLSAVLLFASVATFGTCPSDALADTKVFETPLFWYTGSLDQGIYGGSPTDVAMRSMILATPPERRPVGSVVCFPNIELYGPYQRLSYACEGRDVFNALLSGGVRAFCRLSGFDPIPPGPEYEYCGYFVADADPLPDENLGKCDNCAGNPINVGTGNKFQEETDHASTDDGGLRFSRFYNSLAGEERGSLGIKWRHYWQRTLLRVLPTEVYVVRNDGRVIRFLKSGSEWVVKANGKERLTLLPDGSWILITAENLTEKYDASGRLVSVTDVVGLVTTLTYSDGTASVSTGGVFDGTLQPLPPGMLTKVTDFKGRALEFRYHPLVVAGPAPSNPKGGMISKVIDPAGNIYEYDYDAVLNLTSVKSPGTTNPRTYLYNESAHAPPGANLTHALTGVVDENGARYSTFKYAASGRAISTEHGVGIERHALVFSAGGAVTMTHPLETVGHHVYAHQTKLGVVRPTSLTRPCPGCTPSTATSTTRHDAIGNAIERKDFNGNLTCYAPFDARNLETARTEGLSGSDCDHRTTTNATRTISTTWNATWRMPAAVAEPLRITTYKYHGDPGTSCAPAGSSTSLLCSRIVQATTDATGASAFAATPSGDPRTTSYTYNAVGQVTAVDGPRPDADAIDRTTYTYYGTATTDHRIGDLESTTNAKGHVTQFTRYDGAGRLTKMVDANGLETALEYFPRGWLKSRKVGAATSYFETTSYEYDDVGLLKKVIAPDGSFVAYDYDVAHRLIALHDGLGNYIHYPTLDAMGNRILEEARDPSAVRSSARSRVR